MGLLDKLKHRKLLLRFEIALDEKNRVSARTVLRQPPEDELEWVRFWAFAAARILYEIWFTNTPQAFLVIQRLGMVFARDLDASTDCLKRAELHQFRYVNQVLSPVETIEGEYLRQDDFARVIRFATELPFEGIEASPFLMFASIVLLQYILERVKLHPRGFHVLTSVGRMLTSQFASEQWAGEASAEKLPEAAFQHALS